MGAEKVKRQEELFAAYFLRHAHSTLALRQCVGYLSLLVLQLNCIFLVCPHSTDCNKAFLCLHFFSPLMSFLACILSAIPLLKMHMDFRIFVFYLFILFNFLIVYLKYLYV